MGYHSDISVYGHTFPNKELNKTTTGYELLSAFVMHNKTSAFGSG